jgi:hypothetical protein
VPVVEWPWFARLRNRARNAKGVVEGGVHGAPLRRGNLQRRFPSFFLVSGRQQASGGKLQNRLSGAYDRHPTVDLSRGSAWQVIVCMADPSRYWRVREGHVEFKCGSMIARYISLIQSKYRP